MTDYITIQGVRKRDFTIQTKMPELSETSVNVEIFGTQILWDDNTDILWDDDTQILWSTHSDIYPRVVTDVRKRSFVVHAGKR